MLIDAIDNYVTCNLKDMELGNVDEVSSKYITFCIFSKEKLPAGLVDLMRRNMIEKCIREYGFCDLEEDAEISVEVLLQVNRFVGLAETIHAYSFDKFENMVTTDELFCEFTMQERRIIDELTQFYSLNGCIV